MPWITQLIYTLVFISISQLVSPKAIAQCNCQDNMTVFGIYETATLENIQNLKVIALVDSGATTTALDARNIKMHIDRQGHRWVYYDFRHKTTGKIVSMHQSVTRVARVITHSGKPKERAVVMNEVSIGSVSKFIEMSLINRSNFPQQLLIGRNYLIKTAMVDSGRSFLQSRKQKK